MEVRRKVSELKKGDEVKNYGVIGYLVTGNSGALGVSLKPSPTFADLDCWPTDAEVTVIVPDTEYRITVTYASRDRRALENCWPTSTQCDGWVNEKVKRTVGEIEEVTL